MILVYIYIYIYIYIYAYTNVDLSVDLASMSIFFNKNIHVKQSMYIHLLIM